MQLITSSNADRNLYAGATVLSATPDASYPRLCQVLIKLGDGTKDLTSAGGVFTVTVTVGGNAILGGSETYTLGTAVRAALQTSAFCVPAGQTVVITVTSPNSGDTDVDCTAYLMAEESLATVLAGILASGDVDGYTIEQTLKLILAANAGKVSGAATTTIAIRAADDSKARITATVDSSGNRSALTLDATG